MSKYQAFAWDWYPNGGIKGVSKVLNDLGEAQDWLKYQPFTNHVAVQAERTQDLFDFVQGKEK